MNVTKTNMAFTKSNFSKLQSKLRNKESKAESRFADLLSRSGIYYFREKGNYRTGTRWCYYDFLIPGYDILVEIDGCEHMLPEQRAIDIEKEYLVKDTKYRVVRFTNHEALNLTTLSLEDIIQRLLGKENVLPVASIKQWLINKRQKYSNKKQSISNKYGDIFFSSPVFLYNRESNCFYEFENTFELHFLTSINPTSIVSDLSKEQLRKSKSRKYVMAYSRDLCVERSIYIWGDENILSNSTMEDFIKMVSPVVFLKNLKLLERQRKITNKRLRKCIYSQ